MFGSCTTVWSMARLASQTPAESGPRGWSVTWRLFWSSVTRAHSAFEFGANFSRASAGRIAAQFVLRILSLRCALRLLIAAPRKFCTHQAANFLSEEDASSSEEDTDGSVPLDYNQT